MCERMPKCLNWIYSCHELPPENVRVIIAIGYGTPLIEAIRKGDEYLQYSNGKISVDFKIKEGFKWIMPKEFEGCDHFSIQLRLVKNKEKPYMQFYCCQCYLSLGSTTHETI